MKNVVSILFAPVAFLSLTIFYSGQTLALSQVRISKDQLKFDQAISYCQKLQVESAPVGAGAQFRMISKAEAEAYYKSLSKAEETPYGMQAVVESGLRGDKNFAAFWVNQKGWTLDAIPILPPTLAIPFPEKAPFSLNVYKYHEMRTEIAYIDKRRWVLEGLRAHALCVLD